MDFNFCKILQTITEQQVCNGTNPPPINPYHPNGNMTCVYQIPSTDLPNGLSEQYIFVGNCEFTSNNLEYSNIAGVLNVAYDVNDSPNFQIANGTKILGKPLFDLQLSKVGLIDGPGNEKNALVAAIYMADQLLKFPTPHEQASANPPGLGMDNIIKQGNLLIHCHSGGSRSVTITALYIYYKFCVGTSTTFIDVYSDIICYRWEGGATNHHPTYGICETAYNVLNTYGQLFPVPVLK